MKFIKKRDLVEAVQYDGSQKFLAGCEVDNKGRIFLTHELYNVIHPGDWAVSDLYGVSLVKDQNFKRIYFPASDNPEWEDD